jgi:hypothetical protein
MSRKDYTRIAGELRRSLPNFPKDSDPYDKQAIEIKRGRYHGFALAVEAVARALATDNPRFDSERFYAAVYDDEPQTPAAPIANTRDDGSCVYCDWPDVLHCAGVCPTSVAGS